MQKEGTKVDQFKSKYWCYRNWHRSWHGERECLRGIKVLKGTSLRYAAGRWTGVPWRILKSSNSQGSWRFSFVSTNQEVVGQWRQQWRHSARISLVGDVTEKSLQNSHGQSGYDLMGGMLRVKMSHRLEADRSHVPWVDSRWNVTQGLRGVNSNRFLNEVKTEVSFPLLLTFL